MKVHVISNKAILDDRLGRLKKGDIKEMPDHKASFYLRRGEVELYETKIVRDRPFEAVGKTEPLSASPAAQASPQTTVNESESGAKKTRKKKEQ